MKYYLVDAFFIEKKDIWGTNEELAAINARKTVTFIATKTIEGYKEIKTGRVIPTADLRMHTSTKRPYGQDGHVYLDKRSVNELNKTGAILVTCSHYEEELIRPVTDVDEVRRYLEKDIAKETFEKLDEIKKKGIAKTKETQRMERKKIMEDAKEAMAELKEKYVEKIKEKREEKQLTNDIKNEIKRKR